VAERDYRAKVETAIAFLEGRTIQPIDRVVSAMQEASKADRFELAVRWREKFEHLEWLLAATSRARTAVDLLTFVYRDPGTFGDDRVYLIRQGVVRAAFPDPTTPIESEAFRATGAASAGVGGRDPAPHVVVPGPSGRAAPYHATRRLGSIGCRPLQGTTGTCPSCHALRQDPAH
jgi:hypothetical protein